MFNTQAAISTVFFMAMFLVLSIGSLFAAYHHWIPARIFGFLLIAAAVTGIVSHTVALIVGG